MALQNLRCPEAQDLLRGLFLDVEGLGFRRADLGCRVSSVGFSAQAYVGFLANARGGRDRGSRFIRLFVVTSVSCAVVA